MEQVYVLDNGGNRVLPITHIDSVRDDNGNPLSSLLPETMVASGTNHAGGLVPDTPNTAGTTKFLREDGTWSIPTANGGFADHSKYLVSFYPDASGNYGGTYRIRSRYNNAGGFRLELDNLQNPSDNYRTEVDYADNAGNADSVAYSGVSYGVNAVTTSGAISLDGTIPLHVITLNGNASSVALSANPPSGHSCHVILTAAAEQTVAIAHDSTNRVCPDAEDISLTIPAGGYVEIDFFNANNKVFVRGI